MTLTESTVEEAALEWFREPGYSCLGAEAIAPTLSHGERGSYDELVLAGRLRETLLWLTTASVTFHSLATLCDPVFAGLPKLLSGELSLSAEALAQAGMAGLECNLKAAS